MNYNPYAPPIAQNPAPFASAAPVNGGAPWDTGDVLFTAWHRFKENAGEAIAASVFYSVFALGASAVLPVLVATGVVPPSGRDYWIAYAVSTLASSLVTAYPTVGALRVFIAIARGEKPSFSVALGGFDALFAAFAVHVLYLLGSYGGLLAFIVPGFMFMAAAIFASYVVVDTKKGPIAALAESLRMTKGQRLEVFGFSFVCGLLLLSGSFMCGFGILVTAPVALIAMAIAYVRISGRGIAPPAAFHPGYATSEP